MSTYEAWLTIINELNLTYEQEYFLKGMLYLSFRDSRSNFVIHDTLDNPLIIKIVEFINDRKENNNG